MSNFYCKCYFTSSQVRQLNIFMKLSSIVCCNSHKFTYLYLTYSEFVIFIKFSLESG